jgi:hypothetical protein
VKPWEKPCPVCWVTASPRCEFCHGTGYAPMSTDEMWDTLRDRMCCSPPSNDRLRMESWAQATSVYLIRTDEVPKRLGIANNQTWALRAAMEASA